VWLSTQLAFSFVGVEKVSDHGTIGPRKVFEFPENISPRKKTNCHNLDNRRNSEENHDLRNAIISASILIVRLCINVLDHIEWCNKCCMANAFLRPIYTIRLVVYDCHSDEWKRVLMPRYCSFADGEICDVCTRVYSITYARVRIVYN
jgi:hypothetical protein